MTSIITKIRALSQKTVARGCTPDEAKAAAAKLTELKEVAARWRGERGWRAGFEVFPKPLTASLAPLRCLLRRFCHDLDRLRASYDAAREQIENHIPIEIRHAEWRLCRVGQGHAANDQLAAHGLNRNALLAE